jgi:ribosomal protein S6
MQDYEVVLVLKPLFPEDVKSKFLPAFDALVKKISGEFTVREDGDWGKKHLAYPIYSAERTKYEEGYYILGDLKLSSANLSKLNKSMKMMSDMLRFLIIRKDQV